MAEPQPYLAPRAPINEQPPEDVPTIGYLIGGLIQLGGGAAAVIFTIVEKREANIFGLFLLFLGLRTVIKYRTRIRRGDRLGKAGFSRRTTHRRLPAAGWGDAGHGCLFDGAFRSGRGHRCIRADLCGAG
jgi:hypothetical protein